MTKSSCCSICGTPHCSPRSGNCYAQKAKEYYHDCVVREDTIKFMSYNLMGWNSFNKNQWRGNNVLAAKVRNWNPSVLGAQEVEKGGFGYDDVVASVTKETDLRHIGGSQFFNPQAMEAQDTAWVRLIGGYWMSMTKFVHKKSSKAILFFDSHWKHNHGMEQAEIIATEIYKQRSFHGNPPTLLVGDTNQFCQAHERSAIKYLTGQLGSSPVVFDDVHSQDRGKSFSDHNNPDCRVDFVLATKGQWEIVRSFIDRSGMGFDGTASDHAPLMAELLPIA